MKKLQIYYKTLTKEEKRLLIDRIRELTLAQDVTVRSWIAGRRTPMAICQIKISEIIGIPVNELFQ